MVIQLTQNQKAAILDRLIREGIFALPNSRPVSAG